MNIRWLVPSLIVLALAACSSAPKKPATAGHGGKPSGTVVQGQGSRPAHCPEGSPYAAAKEDPNTRGNYTAGGCTSRACATAPRTTFPTSPAFPSRK